VCGKETLHVNILTQMGNACKRVPETVRLKQSD